MMDMAAVQEVQPAQVQGLTVLVQWTRDVALPARVLAPAVLSTDQPEVPEPEWEIPELLGVGLEPGSVAAQGRAVEVAAAIDVCNA